MAQLSPANFKAITPQQHEVEYSNGMFIEEATGGVVTVRDSHIVDVHDVATHCRVFQDFLGNIDIPYVGDTTVNTNGPWYIGDTSSAGTPTVGLSGDADCGVYSFAFAANDEAEVLTLYWKDEQNIDPASHPIVTWRVKFPTAFLSSTDTFVCGLASALNTTPDTVASHAWFRLEGTSGNLLVETDDGSTDNDDNDTGVDCAADTWYEFRVDASNYSDVKFYYRTSLSAVWTDVTPAGEVFDIHATTGLQPYMQFQKSGGTATNAVHVDYVDVIWRRS